MFQALPQRQAKKTHPLYAVPAAVANVVTPGVSPQAGSGSLHSNGESQQPGVPSLVSRKVLDKAQAATRQVELSLKQPLSFKPHSHHAFRLSFSPTGIPTVEPNQHVGPQATTMEPDQIPLRNTQIPLSAPIQHVGTHAEEPQLQRLTKHSAAGADCCSTQQPGSVQPGSEAQVEVAAVVTASAAQAKLPSAAQANALSPQPVVVSAAESMPLPADATQTVSDAPALAGISMAGDAESTSELQSCTPSGHLFPLLPPPSTPMLAWLDYLGTPESTLLSDVLTPTHWDTGAAFAGEEDVLLGSAVQALVDESTPGLLTASPEAASEAVLHAVPRPLLLGTARREPLPQSSPALPPPPDASSGKGVVRPLPDQATPAPLPHQSTPVLAPTTQGSLHATPHGRPRQATPHLGPPTGLSGLTTPPSAAEMHRYGSQPACKHIMHASLDSAGNVYGVDILCLCLCVQMLINAPEADWHQCLSSLLMPVGCRVHACLQASQPCAFGVYTCTLKACV